MWNLGRYSLDGIATRYGLDGPVIEPWWRARFSAPSRPTLGPTQPRIQWIPGLSRGIKRPGSGVDHPTSSAEVKKIRAIPLLPILAFVACSRVNSTFTFTFTCEIYITWPTKLLIVKAGMNGKDKVLLNSRIIKEVEYQRRRKQRESLNFG
jgi:hypothetical protein